MSLPEDADEYLISPEEARVRLGLDPEDSGNHAVPADEDALYDAGEGPDEPEPEDDDE